jgi:hypothetical protein
MFLKLIRRRAEWKAAIAADARRPVLDRRQARNRQAAGIAIGLIGADMRA